VGDDQGRDLAAWSRAWLETAGISRLDPVVETGPDGRITRLTVTQTATDPQTGAPVDRPHRVVIGLYEPADGGLRRARAVETDVTGPATEVVEAVGGPAALVLVNDDDLTYAKVRLDAGSLATVGTLLSTIPAPLSRALIWSALGNATRDAELPAADHLDIAFRQLPGEPAADLLDAALAGVATAIERYLPAPGRAAARSRLVATCRTGLASAEPGSDTQLTWARHLVRAAATSPDGVDAVRGLLDGGVPDGMAVDADLRWECWVALACHDAASPAELDAALAADDTMTGRQAHLLAEASRPGAASRAATWQRATGDESVTNDQLRALVRGFARPADPPAPVYAERYFAALTGWWAGRTMTMATILARGLFPAGSLDAGARPEDHPVVRQARAWLHAHPDAPGALRRIVVEQLDELERALRAQAAAPGAAAPQAGPPHQPQKG
jgi:aminopeptidase N